MVKNWPASLKFSPPPRCDYATINFLEKNRASRGCQSLSQDPPLPSFCLQLCGGVHWSVQTSVGALRNFLQKKLTWTVATRRPLQPSPTHQIVTPLLQGHWLQDGQHAMQGDCRGGYSCRPTTEAIISNCFYISTHFFFAYAHLPPSSLSLSTFTTGWWMIALWERQKWRWSRRQ